MRGGRRRQSGRARSRAASIGCGEALAHARARGGRNAAEAKERELMIGYRGAARAEESKRPPPLGAGRDTAFSNFGSYARVHAGVKRNPTYSPPLHRVARFLRRGACPTPALDFRRSSGRAPDRARTANQCGRAVWQFGATRAPRPAPAARRVRRLPRRTSPRGRRG